MQRVPGWRRLTGLKIDPTLATEFAKPGIPSNGKCLEPTLRALHEHLLKRVDAEGVGDSHSLDASSGLVELDEIILTLLKNRQVCSKCRKVELSKRPSSELAVAISIALS